MERIGAIYMLTNTVNGKAYVGQTWATPETRWCQHVKQAQRPKHPIAHAIRKHGADAFTLRVIVEGVEDQALLDMLEVETISAFGTFIDSGRGYNATTGGRGRGSVSDETRKKMSASLTGRKRPNAKTRRKGEFRHTPESKAKLSASRVGLKLPPRGKDYRETLQGTTSRFWSDPAKASARREAIAKFWASPESQKRRDAASRFWSDPKNVAARNEKRLARKAAAQPSLLN